MRDHLGTTPPATGGHHVELEPPPDGSIKAGFSCLGEFEILWTGQGYGMHLLDAGGRSFEFEYDLNSPKHGQKVQIKSMEDARHVQRECEKMAADGAHRPVVFRAFEQSGTNMHKNVFGERPKEATQRPITRSARGVPFVKRVGKPEGSE